MTDTPPPPEVPAGLGEQLTATRLPAVLERVPAPGITARPSRRVIRR